MVEERKWLEAKDVEWLRINTARLGRGDYGNVYHGRVKFLGKKPFAVAVKDFHNPLSDEEAGRYSTVIQNLRKAGVAMPKMGMLRHEGRWVQVSEVFKKGKMTKLDRARFRPNISAVEKKKIIDLTVKVLNAGHAPHLDSVGFVSTRKGLVPRLHDIDLLVQDTRQHPAELQDVITSEVTSQLVNLFASRNEQLKNLEELAERVKTNEAFARAIPDIKRIIIKLKAAEAFRV